MRHLKEKIQPYFGKPIQLMREYDRRFEIVSKRSEVLGYVELSEEQEVERIDFQTSSAILRLVQRRDVDSLRRRAEKVVASFYHRPVHFSMAVDWDTHYSIIFAERDPELGLEIPHSGGVVLFDYAGQLISASFYHTHHTLQYEEITFSAEAAKEMIVREPLLKKGFRLVDGEAVLVYERNDWIFGVKLDGTVDQLEEYPHFCLHHPDRVKPVEEKQEYLTLLGVTPEMEPFHEQGNLVWREREGASDWTEEDDESLEYVEATDWHGAKWFQSHVSWHKGEMKSEEELYTRAVQFLQSYIGDLSSYCWSMHKEVEGLEAADGSEPIRSLEFIYVKDGLMVDESLIRIEIGVYSGVIREAEVPSFCTEPFDRLDTTPLISSEEAMTLFTESLTLQLAWVVSNSHKPDQLSLSYILDFPNESGFIDYINAKTGEVVYIESGILAHAKAPGE